MAHHVVPQEIGQQDQQLRALRQPRQAALVGRVTPINMQRDIHAQGSQRFGDVSQPVGTDNDGIHRASLLDEGFIDDNYSYLYLSIRIVLITIDYEKRSCYHPVVSP